MSAPALFSTMARLSFVQRQGLSWASHNIKEASKEQILKLQERAERAIQAGALGISFSLEYSPGISPAEVWAMADIARKYHLPLFFHARYSSMEPSKTNLEALFELVDYAYLGKVSVHIGYINSTGGMFSMKQSLDIVDAARQAGLDITVCTYPYDYWGTYLCSARFSAGWQKRFRITYDDLQLGGSKERLTPASFQKYHREGKMVIAYAIPEQDVEASLRSPPSIVASDGILEPGLNNHPRASGCFSRTIARYVREKKVLSLMDALAKMTILPARRMEQSSSVFKRKGRLSVGADADIVIFDYETIADRATVEHPEFPSAGIEYVIINGQVVKNRQGLVKGVRAGRSIRNDHSPHHADMKEKASARSRSNPSRGE